MEYLEAGAQITIIMGFLGAIFSYAVLRPLNNSIIEFRTLLRELKDEIRHAEERRHALEVRVAEIDQRARSAHHRLDTLVEICEKTHHIKIPHPRLQRSDGECKT